MCLVQSSLDSPTNAFAGYQHHLAGVFTSGCMGLTKLVFETHKSFETC